MLIGAFGWRAVFLINVPVAFVAVLVGWRVLIESRADGVSRKVDVLGVRWPPSASARWCWASCRAATGARGRCR